MQKETTWVVVSIAFLALYIFKEVLEDYWKYKIRKAEIESGKVTVKPEDPE